MFRRGDVLPGWDHGPAARRGSSISEVAGRQVIAARVAIVLGGGSSYLHAQATDHADQGKARFPALAEEEFVGAAPVLVSKEVMEGWNYLYRFITEVEFVLCLEGSVRDGVITIDGFRQIGRASCRERV